MTDADPASAPFLAPLDPPAAYDQALALQIQASVAGVTGLPGALVRPRWQPKPPPQPAVEVDWCAVGATDIAADDNASTLHDPRGNSGDGANVSYRGEEITVLASFYGPNAAAYAARLRDGLLVQRNRAALLGLGLAYAKPGAMRNASALVLTENLVRCDFEFWLRRRVRRAYAVPSIRSIEGAIAHDRASPPTRPARPRVPPFEGEIGVDFIQLG